MAWLLEILSEVILYPVRWVYNRMAKKEATTGIINLIHSASIEKLPSPITDIDGTYWLVVINLGRGSKIKNWFIKGEKELKASVRIRFETDDGDKFSSDAYEVSKGWGRKADTFIIKPNSTIKLALVRRSYDNMYLYPLSGSFANEPLFKTYHLQLVFNLEPMNRELIPSQFKLPSYIKDGEINEL